MIEVIEKVCKQLPKEWEIQLHLENGAAWVTLENILLEEVVQIESTDKTMEEQLNEALCIANASIYLAEDYIEEIQPGVRGYGKYKYRVLGRTKLGPTHHTDDYKDAVKWFEKCKGYWLKLDKEEKK